MFDLKIFLILTTGGWFLPPVPFLFKQTGGFFNLGVLKNSKTFEMRNMKTFKMRNQKIF
jgi:hypothetical protein